GIRDWSVTGVQTCALPIFGRVDRLNLNPAIDHWKARGLDYSAILHDPALPAESPRRALVAQDHGLGPALDNELITACRPALDNRSEERRVGKRRRARWAAA